ncbi:MAG: ATP-binding protein [Acutalibacteraceae bacterium]|nr:ATP-binding protein [Acutalibacteraceae bacterium]
MDRIISNLLVYGDMPKDSILMGLNDIFATFRAGEYSESKLKAQIFTQIKNLLILATNYGFNNNLWHNYLAFILITNENPFSLTCEKVGANHGSVNYFARNDFSAFKQLFDYDFTEIETALNIDCFSRISDYIAIEKKELMYNKNVSEKVQALTLKLEATQNTDEFFDVVTGFYKAYGVGMFGLNKAFRIASSDGCKVEFKAINNMDRVMLDDLIGYEKQKQMLVENTKAFVEGRKANNALLFGDSGTGKSTSIKAIVNEFYPDGLRMIEIYKHQFKDLSNVISQIKNRNYKFIIYMDDLSFEEFEIEYKFLKAVIEGGVETKPDNILIYATSNRRHLIKENWKDKNDMEFSGGLHRSDTIEEKMSLVNRFGCMINYSKPTRDQYLNIVIKLAEKVQLNIPEDELIFGAKQWEMYHGGISGRTAQQYINHLMGVKTE